MLTQIGGESQRVNEWFQLPAGYNQTIEIQCIQKGLSQTRSNPLPINRVVAGLCAGTYSIYLAYKLHATIVVTVCLL